MGRHISQLWIGWAWWQKREHLPVEASEGGGSRWNVLSIDSVISCSRDHLLWINGEFSWVPLNRLKGHELAKHNEERELIPLYDCVLTKLPHLKMTPTTLPYKIHIVWNLRSRRIWRPRRVWPLFPTSPLYLPCGIESVWGILMIRICSASRHYSA